MHIKKIYFFTFLNILFFNSKIFAPTTTITFPAKGSIVQNNKPTILGTTDIAVDAPPDVRVSIDNTLIGFALPDFTTQQWSIDVPSPLSEGAHIVTAQVQAPGFQLTSNNFTVDTLTFVTLIFPSAQQSITPSESPLIIGKSEAGNTINIFIDERNVGTTVADSSGNWQVQVAALKVGIYTLRANATDSVGHTATATAQITVNTVCLPTRSGDCRPVTPIATPIFTSTPTISGTTIPKSTVTIKYTSEIITGTVIADENGNWSFTVPSNTPLSEGIHVANVTITTPTNETFTLTFGVIVILSGMNDLTQAILVKYGCS